MNEIKIAKKTTLWGKWFIIFASLILCIGMSATQAFALVPVRTTGNNFTMLAPDNSNQGGTNDVLFTWDGTLNTAVAASGQVANASISSQCPFSTFVWTTHDVAVYGPGTYTVYSGCPARSPGCVAHTGTPITFTVGANQVGAHMLFNWNTSLNIDVVNVWTKNSAFTPSTMWTGACGSNAASQVWDLMSSDGNGDGINGIPMVDGPFIGFNANFNMMGVPVTTVVDTAGNNFTMNDPAGAIQGGTNDVRFTWDGTMKTSVAVSGQVSNATLSSYCPFSGYLWFAHEVAIYGPGTYTIYSDCPAGSPGCGVGAPITFTVGATQLGGHMLFDWGSAGQPTSCGQTNCAIDLVNVWKHTGQYSALPCDATIGDIGCLFTGACGANPDTTVWDWVSSDFDVVLDSIPGTPFVDGPFLGFNGNMNLKGDPCNGNCNDNDPCTADSCVLPGTCVHTAIPCRCFGKPDGTACDDNNACTNPDTCLGGSCVPGPAKVCNDNNVCTTDSCDTATGSCVNANNTFPCDDNNPNSFGDVCTNGVCIGNQACSPAPTLISPADGQGGLGTTLELRWTKCGADPDGDTLKYHITYCITPGAEGCDSVVDVANAGGKNSKNVFYASGAGLLMIGMTFIGGLRGRKKIIALLIMVTLFAGGAFMSCKNTKNADQVTALGANEMNYMASGLSPNTTYYWKVEADDSRTGGLVSSSTQSFTTR